MDKRKFWKKRPSDAEIAEQIIKEELMKEADRIEESVKDVEVPFQEGDQERLFEKILEQAEQEKTRATHRRIPAKIAAAVLVLGVGIFGFSMTSEGNRLRVMEVLDEVVQDKSQTKINNGEERLYIDFTEKEAREEIYQKLHVKVPEFFYIPEGMEFKTHNIDSNAELAYLVYNYQDDNCILLISANVNDSSEKISVDAAKELVDSIDMNIKGEQIEVKIWYIGEEQKYIAQWGLRNTYYEFGGKIDEAEMKKILEFMLL